MRAVNCKLYDDTGSYFCFPAESVGGAVSHVKLEMYIPNITVLKCFYFTEIWQQEIFSCFQKIK